MVEMVGMVGMVGARFWYREVGSRRESVVEVGPEETWMEEGAGGCRWHCTVGVAYPGGPFVGLRVREEGGEEIRGGGHHG